MGDKGPAARADATWLAHMVEEKYGPLAATFLRLALGGNEDAHNRLRQVLASGSLPRALRDWLQRGKARHRTNVADPRPMLTDAEREEHIRHLAALDYACLDGPCYHPACADALADYSPNGYAYEVHFASWSPESGFTRVAPQEHAPQTRNPVLPRDFTLPHVEDEDD